MSAYFFKKIFYFFNLIYFCIGVAFTQRIYLDAGENCKKMDELEKNTGKSWEELKEIKELDINFKGLDSNLDKKAISN